MRPPVLMLGLLVPLCSCQVGFPRGSLAPYLADFGEGLHEAILVGSSIWLTALPLCSRTQAELLDCRGEAFLVDTRFACTVAERDPMAPFCVVGLGENEYEARWAPAASDAEMLSWCNDFKRELPELSPSRTGSAHLYVYFSRTEAPLLSPLVRLGMHAAIQSPGTISVTCDSAELVGWNDVRFVELPIVRRGA